MFMKNVSGSYSNLGNDQLSNMFRLDGKVIVITGASGLLGSKFVEIIANFGGIPVIVDINQDSSRDLAATIEEKFKISPTIHSIDITNEKDVRNSADLLIKQYGKIDALVNNAANNPSIENKDTKKFSRVENFPLEDWEQDLSVGLTGAFICSKHYGGKIKENPNGGSIINIASDLALIAPNQKLYTDNNLPDDQQPVKPITYSIVKSGLLGLTRYFSTYWIEDGVKCNAICPGGVENGQDADFINRVSDLIPMKRLAYENEYQGALVWILSDASSYLNGAIIPIDGGRTAW